MIYCLGRPEDGEVCYLVLEASKATLAHIMTQEAK